MSVVVNSSMLVAALVDAGPDGNGAEEILSRGALHAPDLARVETVNILRRLQLARRITASEASTAFDDLMQLAVELYPFDPFADRVWAVRHTMTCYDAWYVALAEALQLPLATLDKRLGSARGVMCTFLTPGRP